MKNKRDDKLMEQAFANPKYKGKHVIVVGGQIFVASTGKRANEVLERIHKEYPQESPAITYIPKADTLILWLR